MKIDEKQVKFNLLTSSKSLKASGKIHKLSQQYQSNTEFENFQSYLKFEV